MAEYLLVIRYPDGTEKWHWPLKDWSPQKDQIYVDSDGDWIIDRVERQGSNFDVWVVPLEE
jgi:hypothetical protein